MDIFIIIKKKDNQHYKKKKKNIVYFLINKIYFKSYNFLILLIYKNKWTINYSYIYMFFLYIFIENNIIKHYQALITSSISCLVLSVSTIIIEYIHSHFFIMYKIIFIIILDILICLQL